MAKSKEYIDGLTYALQRVGDLVEDVEALPENEAISDRARDYGQGRLDGFQAGWDAMQERLAHVHDPEPVEQAHDPGKVYDRHFIGMVWVGDRPRHEMYFGADDSVHAVAVALDLAKHLGFALRKGSRKPTVNGTGANGTINGVTMARITVEERAR